MVSSPVAQPVGCACELEIDVQEIETVASEVVSLWREKDGKQGLPFEGDWSCLGSGAKNFILHSLLQCDKL